MIRLYRNALAPYAFVIAVLSLGAPALAAPKTPAQPATAPAPVQPATRDEGTLEVTSDRDLEWLQQDHAYIARGNAVAKRGTVTLMGDTLIADYRPLAGSAAAKAAAAKPAPGGSPAGLDTCTTEI